MKNDGLKDGPDSANLTGHPSVLRRATFRALVVLSTLFAMILVCESLLWIVAPIPWHEWVLWESEGHITGRFVPNQTISTASGHLFRVNRHGFRGPDYEFEKPPGTLRIEVFGGSAALCYKAAGRERSWPGALEIELTERLGMPVEVINLGLPGFTSFKSKINYLCFGRAFDPDVIIVYHTWNDLSRFRHLEREPYSRASIPQNRPLWMRVARATQLGRRARMAEFAIRGRQYDIMTTRMEGTGKDLDRPVRPRAWAWIRQNFSDITSWARSDGVLPVLVTQASLASKENLLDPEIRLHHNAVSRGFTLALAVKTWLEINAIIENVAEEQGAILVNGYNAVPHDLVHIRDNVHLFDRGSDVLASKIADTLLDDGRFLEVADRVRAESRLP